MSSKSIKWPLLLLLATRLAVGITYAVINPPWEAYDETGHFQYVRYLAKHQTLTLQPGDPEADVIWSKFQPPLYYILLAPFLSGFDFGPAFIYPERNPFFISGNAGWNYALNPPQPTDLEATQVTALYVARVLGVIISTLSVLAMFATARLLWPRQSKIVWVATLLYAFWPQFLFVGSMTTNDLLITALATVQVYLAVYLLKSKAVIWPFVAMGLVLIASLLTKLNALALVPLTLLAMLFTPHYGPRVKIGLLALGVGLLTLAVLGLASMQFVTEQVFQLDTLWRFISLFQDGKLNISKESPWWVYGFRTFVASYGWGNVETFNWVYWLWAGLGLAGFTGFLWHFNKMPRDQKELWVVLISLPISIVGLSFALAVAQQDPFLLVGRYWLPALSVLVVMLTFGWQLIKKQQALHWGRQIISLWTIILGWLTPILIIAPRYAIPQYLRESEVETFSPLARFGSALELMHLDLPPAIYPGQTTHLRLCWRASQPITQRLTFRLEVQGPDGQGYGRHNTLPGHGTFPPHFWKVGAVFCETYSVPVQDNFPAPAVGNITIRWLDSATEQPLKVTQLSGGVNDLVSVPITIHAISAAPQIPATRPVFYQLGENLRLTGYAVIPLAEGNSWRVILEWQAVGQITEDAVMFVHLRTAPGASFIQNDSKPRGNTYPTTAWLENERVVDEHILRAPPNTVPESLLLYVGAYHAADPTVRLSVIDEAGQNVLNDEILLDFP